MVDLDFLGRVEVFRELGYAQLKAVAELCEEEVFQEGERLFTEGDEPRGLYAVMEGRVTLLWGTGPRRSTPARPGVTTLGIGATFGWSSLLPPRRYSLSAESEGGACRVLRVDRGGLLDLFEKDPEIGYRVMLRLLEVVSGRFLTLQEEVARRRGMDLINRW
jgi:CRP/FNR family transcriptional regulator, cyclic AMP receptor protein